MRYFLCLCFFLFLTSCEKQTIQQPSEPQEPTNTRLVDSYAAEQTIHLFENLIKVAASEQFIFGQDFPTDFGSYDGLNTDFEQSDCKDIVGDHPGLHGSDFANYLYKTPQEKAVHLNAVRNAFERGAIVIFTFHMFGRDSRSCLLQDNVGLVSDILHQPETRDWFYGELDKVISIIQTLEFPVIFRPWHEMNSGIFWWRGGSSDFKQLWKMTVDYFLEKGVDNVLWCWSPQYLSYESHWKYFPGTDYVDIIGLDMFDIEYDYESEELVQTLEEIIDFAGEHCKIAAFTETGDRTSYPAYNPRFWTKNILFPIVRSEKALRIAWIFAGTRVDWENVEATPSGFIPYKEFDNDMAERDFADFYNHKSTLFESDLLDMYQ